MILNASKLRTNIYRILDHILETGEPIEIERKGKRLKIIPVDPPSKFSRLVKRSCLKGDPESIVHMDWSEEWNSDLP